MVLADPFRIYWVKQLTTEGPRWVSSNMTLLFLCFFNPAIVCWVQLTERSKKHRSHNAPIRPLKKSSYLPGSSFQSYFIFLSFCHIMIVSFEVHCSNIPTLWHVHCTQRPYQRRLNTALCVLQTYFRIRLAYKKKTKK